MKVRQLLTGPDDQQISQKAVAAAGIKLWDYDDEFTSATLVCAKCHNTIGKFNGQWTRVEGDHYGAEYKVSEHVCSPYAAPAKLLSMAQIRTIVAEIMISLDDKGYDMDFEDKTAIYTFAFRHLQKTGELPDLSDDNIKKILKT